MYKIFLSEYTEKIAKELCEGIKKVNVKEIKGDGRFKVVATTEGVDRDGEVIMVSGWDFANFMKNPIILWSHNYRDMNAIIGAVDKIDVVDDNGVRKVIIEGVFANTEAGQLARKLYDDGILVAMSVGFMVKERNGNIITKAELLEVSFVSVPANPDATSVGKEFETIEKLFTPKKDDSTKSSVVPDPLEQADVEKQKAIMVSHEKMLLQLGEFIADMKGIYSHYKDALDAIKPPQESKSGRVLSAKNRSLVETAIEASKSLQEPLQALLDASEPEKEALQGTVKDTVVDLQSLVKILERCIKNTKVVSTNL